MILTFTSKGPNEDFVSVNGGTPMAQGGGSCRTMYDDAIWAGGLSFSDEMIPGWARAKIQWGNYWFAYIVNHGYVFHGHVNGNVSDALGFKTHKGPLKVDQYNGWWSCGKRVHLLNAEQYIGWDSLEGDEAQAKYIEGLFPSVIAAPVEPVKSKVRRAKADALKV